jgi:GT2 family glycosyltransferase
MKATIFISILNYNNQDETMKCLDSIQKIRRDDFTLHTIVIDNASPDGFDLDSKRYSDINIIVIKNKKNTGFSGGHNQGISYALKNGATHVLILNNDTILDKNILEELFHGFDIAKEIGVTVPKIYFSKGSEFHKDRYTKEELGKVIWFAGAKMDWKNVIGYHTGVDEVDTGQFDTSHEVEFGTGACMLIKREVFEQIGMFDENYFLYYEDSDLFMRVKQKGFLLFFIPKAILWHHNASASGGSGSPLQDYYIARNRLLFGLKYAPLRAKIALIREGFRLLLKGRKWQKRAVIDFYLGNLGKGSYNSVISN